VVKNYLRRKKLPREVGWRLGPSPGVLQLAFTDRTSRLLGSHVLKRKKSCAQGRRGRQSFPPFQSPLAEGPRSRGVSNPYVFTTHLIARRSLSPCPLLLVEGAICLPLCGILRRVGIPWLTVAATKTLCKIANVVKR
jgi:hypothetical protein